MSDLFQPLVDLSQVEDAVIATLQTWIQTYLAEIERQRGLRPKSLAVPPGPKSFRGGVDGVTMETEWLPMFHVCPQPLAQPPERTAGGVYDHWFEVKVLSTVADQDEDSARRLANQYGICVAGILGQQSALNSAQSGLYVTRTRLYGYPSVALALPPNRYVLRSTTTVGIRVQSVMTEQAGPIVVPANPYANPESPPTVQSVNINVTATDDLSSN